MYCAQTPPSYEKQLLIVKFDVVDTGLNEISGIWCDEAFHATTAVHTQA